MGTTWHALGYELVCLWLRSGIPLVTKRRGTNRFGNEPSKNHLVTSLMAENFGIPDSKNSL